MKYKISDLVEKIVDNRGKTPNCVGTGIPLIEINAITSDKVHPNYNHIKKYITEEVYESLRSGGLKENDILIGTVGTLGTIALMDKNKAAIAQNLIGLRTKENVSPIWLYYVLKYNMKEILNLDIGGVQPSIKVPHLMNFEIDVPSFEKQNKIAKIMKSFDEKIETNNEINRNLEEQLKILFKKTIDNCKECEKRSLYDEFNVIDNRGKTPPSVEKSIYPIIDVKVLSGNNRIIDYDNALKYVDKEIYDNFFRSGHPQKYDALISTVGSLAEMKLFLEDKGTIAQNVVALRPKNEYPLFMYQYLLNIRKKLITYDIGSVQPSIKVTQFMKEIVDIPSDMNAILKFEKTAKVYTEKMLNNMLENKTLEQFRNTILPKLIRDELDINFIVI